MEHHAEVDSARPGVKALPFAVVARLDIRLTLARTEKYIPSSAFFNHTQRNLIMLVLVLSVLDKVGFCSVRVRDKMRAHLINRLGKICINGQIAFRLIIAYRADIFVFRLYRIDNTNGIYHPHYARFPVNTLCYSL